MLGSLLKVLTPIDVPNKGMSLKGLYKPCQESWGECALVIDHIQGWIETMCQGV